MASSPEACPACKGSGALLKVTDRAKVTGPVPHPLWYLYEGYGFVIDPCLLCGAKGTLVLEPLPSFDPREWLHRVPEGVFRD